MSQKFKLFFQLGALTLTDRLVVSRFIRISRPSHTQNNSRLANDKF